MKKNKILFIALLIVVSCSKDRMQEYRLTGGNIKYWDLYFLDKGISNNFMLSKKQCWKFSSSGQFDTYLFKRDGRLLALSIVSPDIIKKNRWTLKNDSLFINNNAYHFLMMNQDTILLKSKNKALMLIINKQKIQEECLSINCSQTKIVKLR